MPPKPQPLPVLAEATALLARDQAHDQAAYAVFVRSVSAGELSVEEVANGLVTLRCSQEEIQQSVAFWQKITVTAEQSKGATAKAAARTTARVALAEADAAAEAAEQKRRAAERTFVTADMTCRQQRKALVELRSFLRSFDPDGLAKRLDADLTSTLAEITK